MSQMAVSIPRIEFFDRARCREVDLSVFYPEAKTKWTVSQAKAICTLCPVRIECLEYALDTEFIDGAINGIWGGKTERERRKLLEHRTKPVRYCIRGHEQTPEVAYRFDGQAFCRICVQETRKLKQESARKLREYRQRQRQRNAK